MLTEHTSTLIEERLAPATPVAVRADGPRRGSGALLLFAVVAAELVWGALLVWFVARLIV